MNLNSKLSSAIMNLRFDKYLLIFDIVKAFLNLSVSQEDSDRLCFLWFNNLKENDFTIVAYRTKRVPFGLRCSSTLLMIALYYIMLTDIENNNDQMKNCKKLLYHLFYVDNGAFTSCDQTEINWLYNNLNSIFNPYGFHVQQLLTNECGTQCAINESIGSEAPNQCKLLGMMWNRANDNLYCANLALDETATTKRTVLRSIASCYDIFNFNLPLLNKAKLFMHALQCKSKLNWDEILPENDVAEWKRIARQFNSNKKNY